MLADTGNALLGLFGSIGAAAIAATAAVVTAVIQSRRSGRPEQIIIIARDPAEATEARKLLAEREAAEKEEDRQSRRRHRKEPHPDTVTFYEDPDDYPETGDGRDENPPAPEPRRRRRRTEP